VSRRRLVLLAALGWCFLIAALEGYRTVRLYMNRPWSDERPSQWRLGSDPVVRLRALTAEVDARLPAPARVAFASPLAGQEAHIHRMWTAYLLPRHDVVAAGAPGSEVASHWLSLGDARRRALPRGDAERLFAGEEGALYRLPLAGPAEGSSP
jgi:hypothetical protein